MTYAATMAKHTTAREADYQRTIVEAARIAGWKVHAERPAYTGRGRVITPIQGDKGFPDLVLVHERRATLAFVELKRKPNKPTEEQLSWMSALGQLRVPSVYAGIIYVPEDLDAFLAFLTGVGSWPD